MTRSRVVHPQRLRPDYAAKRAARNDGILPPGSRAVRLYVLFAIAVLWGTVVVWRLYSLQIANFATWRQWASRQHVAEVTLASERGAVFDRNEKLLAVSVPAGSIYARPRQVKDREGTAAELARLLGAAPATVLKRLSTEKPFVWLGRQIPRQIAEKATALKLPGIGHVLESRRFYPYNHAASRLLGKVGIDGTGLSGIERSFEKTLHGGEMTTQVMRDAYGNMIQAVSGGSELFRLPKGSSVKLTIDVDIQSILDQELERGKTAAKAKSAIGLMIDSETGEVLGMSQAPGINFNNAKLKSKAALRNLVVETVYEPGSVIKPLVAAAALDAGVVTSHEQLDCEHGKYHYGTHIINDTHPNDIISFHDVVVRSSNIGMTKVGDRMGKERLYGALRRFGFGEVTGLHLPGETAGILRRPEGWSKVDIATHSFGQGVAVTPLQIARAMAAIANGGLLPPLKIVLDAHYPPPVRVVSAAAAEETKSMLYGVVTAEKGTAPLAAIPGVQIGGKTGTAQKANPRGGGYLQGAYMASFVGFAEASAIGVPRLLTLIIVIDEPDNGSIYGGVVAAPVFRRVMQRTLHLLATRQEFAPSGTTASRAVRLPYG